LFTGNFEPLSPKCIYACKTFLVLEDLSVAGFGMGERRKGLDLEYCVLLMHTVARFHAASAVLHQQDPDSMKEYDNSFLCDPSVNKTWPPLISGEGRNGEVIININVFWDVTPCELMVVKKFSRNILLPFYTLKMEVISSSEKLVTFYHQTKRRHIPEDSNHHIHHHKSFKSHKELIIF
jgi:hypothetical protein